MELFANTFGRAPVAQGFVPGRVNLIGEHTDYNGGAVLPTALSVGTRVALCPRSDGRVRVASAGFVGVAERTLAEAATGHWSDYALGAVRQARSLGWLDGADIAVASTVPAGAGLSSSASLLVNILKRAREVAGADMSDTDIALAARTVETEFIGVPCGIMDQMAVALAAPGRALLLDTHTLARDLIDLPRDPVVAVLHSGVERKLADGRYRERAEECAAVKATLGREDICRAPLAALSRVDSPVLARRLRHCITEHARTLGAAEALRDGDWPAFGALMVQSHASLRDDFAVSTPAIDALVETCMAQGAVGARMTGGGFGGCIVALVDPQEREAWQARVLAAHPAARPVA